MKKLQKPVIVLISMASATLLLAVILFIAMPSSIKDSVFSNENIERHFQSHGNNNSLDSEKMEVYKNFHKFSFHKSHSKKSGFIFLFILIIGTVIVVKHKKHNHKIDSSLSILSEQFAEGKISEEEYKRKKAKLEENN